MKRLDKLVETAGSDDKSTLVLKQQYAHGISGGDPQGAHGCSVSRNEDSGGVLEGSAPRRVAGDRRSARFEIGRSRA